MTLRPPLLFGLCAVVAAQSATFPPHTIRLGGSVIEIEFSGDGVDLPEASVMRWISNAAHAVAEYDGGFPVQRAQLKIHLVEGRDGVFYGTTWGLEDHALTRISLGRHTTQAQLDDDWMLTHEMVHMGFPSVPDENHWIEEGIATYVEPIARVQAGQLTAQRIWADMVRSMPQGEPEAGDQGLDNTHTWGRTYWGGALFCLVADVRIRERTHNRKGLQDALRGILKAGGNIEVDWPIERALKTGDAATGATVLTELYAQMRATPVRVDLPELWQKLGIALRGRDVVFDDQAALAAVRRAITARKTGP